VYSVGHPSAGISEPTTTCDAVIVEVTGPIIDKLVTENPYYFKATIPGGMYRGTDKDVQTFGVGATLVASADVPEEVVYTLVKAVFQNLDSFKSLHPALKVLEAKTMATKGLSAPLHPGAEKYFKEAGLI
ncbi:MAG: TAXI family TRAP transporter solute-binding subunit, partial [Geminicoccales bacterium]